MGKAVEKSIAKSFGVYILLSCLSLLLPLVFMLFSVRTALTEYDWSIKRVNVAGELKNEQIGQLEEGAWLLAFGRRQEAEPYRPLQASMMQQISDLIREEADEKSIWFLRSAERTLETVGFRLAELAQKPGGSSFRQADEEAYRSLVENCRLAKRALNHYIDSVNHQIIEGNNRIQHSFYYFIALLLDLVLLILTVNFALCKRFKRIIRGHTGKLTDFVKKLSTGNLDISLEPIRIEELYELSLDLDKMAKRLRVGMEERLRIQNELREAELRILQDQIKPHFIYNTLGSIVWLAEEERYSDIVDLTMQLTCFLRISLSKGAHLIPIRDEISHVNSYLEILKVRYGEQISYKIDVDPSIQDRLILKQTLQPLVENGIYHGIRQCRSGKGEISIQARPVGDRLFFSVKDNGIGMQPEKLNLIRRNLAAVCRSDFREDQAPGDQCHPPDSRTRSADRGYGLYNVASRLWIFYGVPLQVESEYRKGSCFFFSYCPEREINWLGGEQDDLALAGPGE